MKKINLFFLAFLLSSLVAMAQTTKKSFTLNELLSGGSTFWNLRPKNITTTWWGETLLATSEDDVRIINAKGKQEEVLFTREAINKWIGKEKTVRTCNNLTFPYPNTPLVLFQGKREWILVNFITHDVEWRQKIEAKATEISWNKVSRNMAYCVGSNVVVLTANGERYAVTTNGNEDIVYGQSVSRQEFGIEKGLFWSPDGQRLAFYKKDQSHIPSYPQVDISKPIAATYTDKYPMAGTESEEVSVGIFEVATQQLCWLQNTKPLTDYITNLSWAPDNKHLYVFELNREQNYMQLFGYDATTGTKDKTPILEELHPKYVEPEYPLTFLPWDATKAIMISRRDNWRHLWLLDMKAPQKGKWHDTENGGTACDHVRTTLLTPGDFEVMNLHGFNTKEKSAIFVCNATHPLKHTIFKVVINGKHRMKMLGTDDGVHTISISNDGQQLVDRYSSPTVPRSVNVINIKSGKSLNLLTAENPLKDYNFPEITSGSIKAADGETDLYYRLVKPIDFDPAKKYPTVVYVYGGPHLYNVDASWGYRYRGWEIYMAQKGYVVFVLDNRGSENRGLKFENVTHRHLGEEEMKDQLCGVEFLKTLPYVDAERMGVHGWSFGGFMTINLMCTYPDIFKVGVAGGPVIDWKYYEVMYGERYMDRPEENPEGYKASSLLNKAKNLKGRLQVIFGYNDPTCVPQHSIAFMRACIDAKTQPDLFLYPGSGHNMGGADQIHLHERITRYFEDFLK